MIESRKRARKKLKAATLSEYEAMVREANLTPFQSKILSLHLLQGFSICKISLTVSYCESLVRRRLSEAYDKIAKL